MKKFPLFALLLTIFMMTTASTCSNDDNGNSNPTDNTLPVINTASSGTWRITNYNEDGADHTAQYTGFNFAFGSGNVLTSVNGSNTYTGTWSVTDSESGDDDSSELHFNIGFSTPASLADLSDDWHIVSYTSSKIDLIDLSGGNGGTDYLTFEKN